MRRLLLICSTMMLAAAPALADRDSYLDLARRGWNYELRTTMIGRDMTIPVHINGRDLAGASLCIVGERPHAASLEVVDAFRSLVHRTFGKRMTMRYAGRRASDCGSGRTLVLRLYSGFPPNEDLSEDLRWLNRVYALGLGARGFYAASSPAMAQTFFGRRGKATHIMVQQSALDHPGGLERAFYKSILIEELFQSFTFGMDILLIDRDAVFQSKLQEMPVNLYRLPWNSRRFMRALVRSNPAGLCAFDIFMMHAVALAPVDQTTDPEFITYIDGHYDELLAEAQATLADPAFAIIVEPECRQADGRPRR